MNEKKYPVYCAWCEEKGIQNTVSWSSVPFSHGICKSCFNELRKETENLLAERQVQLSLFAESR